MYLEKATDLSQVTFKPYHIINAVASKPRHERDSNSQRKW